MGDVNQESTQGSNRGNTAHATRKLMCKRGGLRSVFWKDKLKSVVKKETQPNKMWKQDSDIKKRLTMHS